MELKLLVDGVQRRTRIGVVRRRTGTGVGCAGGLRVAGLSRVSHRVFAPQAASNVASARAATAVRLSRGAI